MEPPHFITHETLYVSYVASFTQYQHLHSPHSMPVYQKATSIDLHLHFNTNLISDGCTGAFSSSYTVDTQHRTQNIIFQGP